MLAVFAYDLDGRLIIGAPSAALRANLIASNEEFGNGEVVTWRICLICPEVRQIARI